jgi:hypothetical protein
MIHLVVAIDHTNLINAGTSTSGSDEVFFRLLMRVLMLHVFVKTTACFSLVRVFLLLQNFLY